MKGYIKDYRKELESDIWAMPPLYHRVWQYLKYQVNHKQNTIPMEDGSSLTIEKGQHLTSVRSIAKGVGYYERKVWKEPNPKTINAILKFLENSHMIHINRGKSNRQFTLITLLNWETYQSHDNESNDESNTQVTVKKQSLDINKNVKNEKNEKKINNSSNVVPFSSEHNPFEKYHECYGKFPTPKITNDIQQFEQAGMEQRMICLAIEKAAGNGSGFQYALGILNNWKDKGLYTYEQALNERKRREESKHGEHRESQDSGSQWIDTSLRNEL